jgi:hypothetical protein
MDRLVWRLQRVTSSKWQLALGMLSLRMAVRSVSQLRTASGSSLESRDFKSAFLYINSSSRFRQLQQFVLLINYVQATSVSQHQLILHFSQQTVPLQLQARTIHSSKYLVVSTNTPTTPANLTTLYNQKLPVLTTTRSHVSPPDELFVHGGSENKRDEGKRKNKKRTGRQPWRL